MMIKRVFFPARFISTSIIMILIWVLLVGNLHWQEIIFGAVVAMFIAYISSAKMRILDDVIPRISLPIDILHYLVIFLRALIASNLDMARRVISPTLPIDPSMVEITTQLQSRLGKLILANSITLTPGTLTVDVIEDRLRIHWIDSRISDDLEKTTSIIAERFERPLRKFIR